MERGGRPGRRPHQPEEDGRRLPGRHNYGADKAQKGTLVVGRRLFERKGLTVRGHTLKEGDQLMQITKIETIRLEEFPNITRVVPYKHCSENNLR
jgi:hypothetical protein